MYERVKACVAGKHCGRNGERTCVSSAFSVIVPMAGDKHTPHLRTTLPSKADDIQANMLLASRLDSGIFPRIERRGMPSEDNTTAARLTILATPLPATSLNAIPPLDALAVCSRRSRPPSTCVVLPLPYCWLRRHTHHLPTRVTRCLPFHRLGSFTTYHTLPCVSLCKPRLQPSDSSVGPPSSRCLLTPADRVLYHHLPYLRLITARRANSPLLRGVVAAGAPCQTTLPLCVCKQLYMIVATPSVASCVITTYDALRCCTRTFCASRMTTIPCAYL